MSTTLKADTITKAQVIFRPQQPISPLSSKSTYTGQKHDQEKPRWDLIPYSDLEKIVQVLTFGAKKYGPENWKLVENASTRYFAAAMRHLVAYKQGEKIDPESGLHHLAHASCCLLFMMHLDP